MKMLLVILILLAFTLSQGWVHEGHDWCDYSTDYDADNGGYPLQCPMWGEICTKNTCKSAKLDTDSEIKCACEHYPTANCKCRWGFVKTTDGRRCGMSDDLIIVMIVCIIVIPIVICALMVSCIGTAAIAGCFGLTAFCVSCIDRLCCRMAKRRERQGSRQEALSAQFELFNSRNRSGMIQQQQGNGGIELGQVEMAYKDDAELAAHLQQQEDLYMNASAPSAPVMTHDSDTTIAYAIATVEPVGNTTNGNNGTYSRVDALHQHY